MVIVCDGSQSASCDYTLTVDSFVVTPEVSS